MPAFHFSLGAVLKLRESTRDERRLELAELVRQAEELERKRMATLDELSHTRARHRAAASSGTVDVRQAQDFYRYESALLAHCDTLTKEREQLEPELERRRQAVVEATREVRTLEILRDRRLAEHRQAESRAETKRLDELVTVAERTGRLDGRLSLRESSVD